MNDFAPQPLVGLIAASFGLGPSWTSIAATATLLGYAVGLFFLVPLSDIVESRALAIWMLIGATCCAAVVTVASNVGLLLLALVGLGAGCSAVQVLVPIAASMAEPERRGRMIGDVMSGMMAGILLSRPLASFLSSIWGWRGFYFASVVTLIAVTIMLALALPHQYPERRARYTALVASLGFLLRTESVLRRRSLTAALVMAAFSLFWTAVGLRLTEPPYSLTQSGIAIFALAGAGGTFSAPMFGRIGDAGRSRQGLLMADIILIFAIGLSAWGGAPSALPPTIGLVLMCIGAFWIDVGITGDQTLGRRMINLLAPEVRGRVNGLFVGIFFIGGAIGSALAGPALARGGWAAVCGIAGLLASAALLVNWSDRHT